MPITQWSIKIKNSIAMKERQIVAIDVGSSNVVIAVGTVENDGRVNIQGIASEPISGIDADTLRIARLQDVL